MTTRIVIVGGGFGGLEAAFSLKALLRRPFKITLIDRSAYHAFIPSIHLIVSGKASATDIRIPLKVVLGAAGIRFVQGEAHAVNTVKREVMTGSGTLCYDYLVLSSGAENNFFDVPGAEEFSYPFRTPENAERIRNELTHLFDDPRCQCRIALAGGGTEGVEVAGELLDLVRKEGREKDLKSGQITIDMIEGKTQLLPSFPQEVQKRVEEYLQQQGVTLIAGDRIAEVQKDSIILGSGQRREASVLIWTGGIQPSKLIRDLPLAKDPGGWLKVTNQLRSFEDERVYGIGDAVSIYTGGGPLTLQRLAYHAQDQARVAALNIAAALSGQAPVNYTPRTKPQLISIGKNMGIFTLEDRVSYGPWVVSLKKAVERKHLMTYLTRPVSSALWARVPGAGINERLRLRLPM